MQSCLHRGKKSVYNEMMSRVEGRSHSEYKSFAAPSIITKETSKVQPGAFHSTVCCRSPDGGTAEHRPRATHLRNNM